MNEPETQHTDGQGVGEHHGEALGGDDQNRDQGQGDQDRQERIDDGSGIDPADLDMREPDHEARMRPPEPEGPRPARISARDLSMRTASQGTTGSIAGTQGVQGERRVVLNRPNTGKRTIRPRKDLPRVRIGNDWFSFAKGVETVVPAEIMDHLRRKGII